MNAGPLALGFSILPLIEMYSSTIPLCIGNAPVPISACPVGVFEGDDPTVAWVNQAPLLMSAFRYGHDFGQRLSTSIPPESQTMVTISLGGVAPGTSACVCAVPSTAWNGKFNI